MSLRYNNHITSVELVKQDVRIISMHVDNEKINIFIEESEQQDLKNALGDSFFVKLIEYVNRDYNVPNVDAYENLLNGCIYEANETKAMFLGLRKALNYFTYARLVQHGDGQVSRTGFMNKETEYSSHAELKQRQEAYKSAYQIAEGYMNDCLKYIRYNSNLFPEWEKQYIRPVRGVVITKIGD